MSSIGGFRPQFGGQRPDPSQFLAKADTDGDGNISFAEFSALQGPGGPNGRQPTAEMKQQFFSRMDSNGDGNITQTELQAAQAQREQRHAEFLKKADTNGDGTLSQEELAAARPAGRPPFNVTA